MAITSFAREPCLKGTMGYAPALVALVLVAALLRRQHPAGPKLLVAAGMFLAAMILRWVDRDACPYTWLFGSPRGTHALWHLLNAAAGGGLRHPPGCVCTALNSRPRPIAQCGSFA